MIIRPLVVLLLLLTFACSAATPEEEALTFVETLDLGQNLEALTEQVAKNTQTYRMIVATVGADGAEDLLESELSGALPKYQSRWNANLAASYLLHFSPEELRSLAEERAASPYLSKFQEKQRDVGLEMQSRSGDLLQEAAAEVVENAFRSTTQ